NPPVKIPKGYRFPTRQKIPYRPSLEKIGVFHSPDLEPQPTHDLIGKEAAAYRLLFNTEITPWSNLEGVVYYPVWKLEYSYRGDRYHAAVDATDGTVLYMEYPLSRSGRMSTVLQAAAVVAGSAAIGAVVASQLQLDPQWGAIGGVLASLGAVVRLITFAAARRGIYESTLAF
ncbi:MAG: transcription factor IIB, partial [Pyrobaculum sp.]